MRKSPQEEATGQQARDEALQRMASHLHALRQLTDDRAHPRLGYLLDLAIAELDEQLR